ncbi:unnamed protein product [Caenorhabditis nigoni]
MPINLLKLPRLVGEMVVTESDYHEVFLLSLCSRRSLSLVKKAGIKTPKLTFRFEELLGYNRSRIGYWIGQIFEPIITLAHVTKLKSKKKSSVKFELDYKADTNLKLRCLKTFMQYDSCEPGIVCANEQTVVQKAFQDYINSIFHYSDTYHLIISTECKGRLPNISNVKHIEIDDTADTQFLTHVLTKYPNPESLYVILNGVGELPKDSPLFQIPNIFVGYICGPDYFYNFAGRNMMLYSVTLSEQDVIQFLHKWISNEAYHDLETLFIGTENTLNRDLILQAIEFEEYNPKEPEKRPAKIVVDVPYIPDFNDEYDLEEGFIEIKRTTVGKRAFLAIDDMDFKFLVYNN